MVHINVGQRLSTFKSINEVIQICCNAVIFILSKNDKMQKSSCKQKRQAMSSHDL